MIEWGDGIYGAEAAARRYFKTSAAQLGPQEAALLAAAITSPRVFDPSHPSNRLRRRATPPEDAAPTLPAAPGGAPEILPGEALPVGKFPRDEAATSGPMDKLTVS